MAVTPTRSQLEERLSDALDQALLQPLIVAKRGRSNVLLSDQGRECLRARGRCVVRLEDWTDGEIAAIEAMEPGSAEFDAGPKSQ